MGEFSVSVKATANTEPFKEQIKAMNNKHTVSVKAKVVITKKSIQDQISAIDLNQFKIPVKVNSAELKKAINGALEAITSQKSGIQVSGIKIGISKDQVVGELNRVFDSITNKFTVAVRVTKDQLRKEIKSKLDGIEINAKIKANNQQVQEKGKDAILKNSKDDGLVAKVSKWYLAQIPIRLLGQALQETKNAISEFDASLTEFKKVSDLGGDSLQDYVEKLGELGQEVGRTRAEMTDLATEFRKSGFSDEDAQTLSKVGAMYQNVADSEVSASKSAGFITSQLRAFNMEAEDGIQVVDKVNEVSNNFAVSSTNIADGMTKTSSAFASFGNDINETIALITAGTEILTNQPGKVAKGLRSVGAELVKIAGDTGQLGFKVNGVSESIQLVDSETGKLTSTYEVLDQLSTKYWDKMTEEEKTSLALKLGMKTQYETFTATINNWSQAQNAYTTALNSSGSAEQENARAMESLDKKANQLKATFSEIVLGSGGLGNFSKTLLDVGNVILTMLNNPIARTIITITAFGVAVNGLNIALEKMATMKLFSGISNIGESINKYITMFKAIKEGMYAKEFANITTALKASYMDNFSAMTKMKVNAQALKGTMGSLWSTIGTGTKVLGAIGIALTAYSLISNYVKKKEEERKQAYEKAQNEFNESSQRVNELNSKISENTKTIKENIDVVSKRKDTGLTNSEDKENLKEETELLKDELNLEKEIQAEKARKLHEETKDKTIKDLKENADKYNDDSAMVEYLNKGKNEYTSYTRSDELGKLGYSATPILGMDDWKSWRGIAFDDINGAIEQTINNLKFLNEEKKRVLDSDDDIDDKKEKIDLLNKALGQEKSIRNGVAKSVKTLLDASKQDLKYTDKSSDEYKEKADEVKELEEAYKKIAGTVSSNTSKEEDAKQNLEALQQEYADVNESLSNTSTSIDEMQSAWDTLSSAQEAYNQCGYLTLDQFQGILNIQPQYLSALMDENGQLQFNEQGFQNLANQMLFAKISQLEFAAAQEIAVDSGQELQVSAENTGAASVNLSNNLITAGNTAVDVASRIAQVNDNVREFLSLQGIQAGSYDEDRANEIIDKYKNIAKSLADMSDKVNTNRKAINLNSGAVGGNSRAHGGNTGARNKNKDAIDKQTKALEKQKQALQDQIDKLEEQKEQYENTFKYLERLENEKKEKTEAQQKKDEDAVNKKYDKLVKPLEKQKEKLEDRNYELEKQISVMEKKADKELEKLERQNDELDKMTEKEKLLIELAKAKEQHKMVYRDGVGFVFESDANAITSARNELNNWQRSYNYDKTKSRIENSVKNSPQSAELEANNEVLKELNHNVDVYERKRSTALDNVAKKYKPVLDEIEKTQKTLKDAQERYEKIVEKASAQKLLKGSISDWTSNRVKLLQLGKDYAEILGAINNKKKSVDAIGRKIQNLKNNSSTANKNVGKVAGSTGKIKGVTGAINGLNNAIKKLDYKALQREADAAAEEAEALAHYAGDVAKAKKKKNGPNLIERYKASVKKSKKHASGVANIEKNEFAIVGENPNKEIVLGSQLNNGVMMGLEKGSGVVNAQSTNTLAGILNTLGSSNVNAKQTRLASDGQVINIQNITLPNVNNGEDFVKYLQNFRDDILRKG